jgi:hypothetical protein
MTPSRAFIDFCKATVELHALVEGGRGDSPEADTVRDFADPLWASMNEKEQEKAKGFSALLDQLPAYLRGEVIRRPSHFVGNTPQ